jgi:hypothetical protein
MKLNEMSDEEIQNAERQRLVGMMTGNGSRQKVVRVQEVGTYIGQGYEYAASLPDDQAIVKIPF